MIRFKNSVQYTVSIYEFPLSLPPSLNPSILSSSAVQVVDSAPDLVTRAVVIHGVLQAVVVAPHRRCLGGALVPETALTVCVLQTGQVTPCSSEVTSVVVPGTPMLAQVLQAV